jgi:hypothetical protein
MNSFERKAKSVRQCLGIDGFPVFPYTAPARERVIRSRQDEKQRVLVSVTQRN